MFLVTDNRVFNKPLGRSLRRSLTPLTRSVALCFAKLALLAHSIHGLAHSLLSLPHGTVKFINVFTLKTRATGTNAFLDIHRNTPLHHRWPLKAAEAKAKARKNKGALLSLFCVGV